MPKGHFRQPTEPKQRIRQLRNAKKKVQPALKAAKALQRAISDIEFELTIDDGYTRDEIEEVYDDLDRLTDRLYQLPGVIAEEIYYLKNPRPVRARGSRLNR